MIVNEDKNRHLDQSKERLDEIAETIKTARTLLEGVKSDLYTETYRKVCKELSTAISACKRANKELDDIRPMEGQMDLFDLL